MKSLLILGAGGFGRMVAETAQALGYEKVVFLDDAVKDEAVIGMCCDYEIRHEEYPVAVAAIGNNMMRLYWTDILREKAYAVPAIVHPSAGGSPRAVLEPGCFVMQRAVVNTNARIGRAVLVNSGAIVDHNSVVCAGAHVGLGSVVKSDCTIESGCKVEAGEVIFSTRRKIEGVDSNNTTGTAVAAKSTIGIDKKSADYTVLVRYDGTKDFDYTITVDDNAKIYAVDEDGNITESSYKAITKDTNDKVYAVIEDYLVKALVIGDVDDGKAPEVTEGNGTFDVTVSKNSAGALELSYINYVVEGYPNFGTDWEGTKGKVTVTLVVDGETFTQTTSYKGTQTVQHMLDNAKVPSITLDLASGGVKVKATVTVTFDGMYNDTYKLVGTSGLSILG